MLCLHDCNPEVTELSLKLISLINSFNIRCSVLTKGILPKELGDKERFNADNVYGISLISLNEEFRKQWEPGKISYTERIEALKQLHENGCKTLAHIEPYPTPNILKQDLLEIMEVIKFVDYIHFSGWNYNNRIKMFPGFQQFYYEQSNLVKYFCSKHGIPYNNRG